MVGSQGQSLGRLDEFREDSVVIRVKTSIPESPGCLFEAGATGAGTFIGLVGSPGSLRFRFTAFEGGTVGDTSDVDTAVIVISLPDHRIPQDGKAHELIMTINVPEHTIQLVVDGILVATAKSNAEYWMWSGGDEANVGKGGAVATGGDPSPWQGEFEGQMHFWRSSAPFNEFSLVQQGTLPPSLPPSLSLALSGAGSFNAISEAFYSPCSGTHDGQTPKYSSFLVCVYARPLIWRERG